MTLGSLAAGRSRFYELNAEQRAKAYVLTLHYRCFFWVKQILHTKAPDLIFMLSEGEHHTPATLALIVSCVQHPVIQDTQVCQPALSRDQSHAKAGQLLQKNSSVDNNSQFSRYDFFKV